MDDKKLQQLKKALEDEKIIIETQLNRIAKPNPDVKDDWKATMVKPDQSETNDEKAHSITSYETRRAIEQQLEQRLKEVNQALLSIKTNTYGSCVSCKNDIPHERLTAIPVTIHCIDCQKKEITEV